MQLPSKITFLGCEIGIAEVLPTNCGIAVADKS
jgi:hypothetical protein